MAMKLEHKKEFLIAAIAAIIGAVIAFGGDYLKDALSSPRPSMLVNPESLSAVGTMQAATLPQEPPTYLYAIVVENDGNSSFQNLPVRFVFKPAGEDFKILKIIHRTTPKHEFGKISEEEPDPLSRRFVYEYLHPSNLDQIEFITNGRARIEGEVNADGVSISKPIFFASDDGDRLVWTPDDHLLALACQYPELTTYSARDHRPGVILCGLGLAAFFGGCVFGLWISKRRGTKPTQGR